jgi:hypothetical protein
MMSQLLPTRAILTATSFWVSHTLIRLVMSQLLPTRAILTAPPSWSHTHSYQQGQFWLHLLPHTLIRLGDASPNKGNYDRTYTSWSHTHSSGKCFLTATKLPAWDNLNSPPTCLQLIRYKCCLTSNAFPVRAILTLHPTWPRKHSSCEWLSPWASVADPIPGSRMEKIPIWDSE